MTVEQIRQILNEEDIEGLLQAGAPADEYETEAERITQAVAQADELTEDRLTVVVQTMWREMFGPLSEEQLGLRHSAFRRVAHRILAQRHQGEPGQDGN